METVFSILLNILFIYLLVRFLANLFDLYIVHRVVTEIRREQQEDLAKRIVQVYVEKINDCFYIFNKEDHSFLAQGKDKNEIQKMLSAKFPGYAILVDNDQLKEVGLHWD
jgi:uncharacterized membrane protein